MLLSAAIVLPTFQIVSPKDPPEKIIFRNHIHILLVMQWTVSYNVKKEKNAAIFNLI